MGAVTRAERVRDGQALVRRVRAQLGMTQEGFARFLGCSFATVNRWENGRSPLTGGIALEVLRGLDGGHIGDHASIALLIRAATRRPR